MKIILTKGSGKFDRITCIREDKTETSSLLPKQGILPHDVFHFVVEKTLHWENGFLGFIKKGMPIDPNDVHLHKRDWSKDIQALQSECLVEVLQAEQWGGESDVVTFKDTLAISCKQRKTPTPKLSDQELKNIKTELKNLGAVWRPLNPGGCIELEF